VEAEIQIFNGYYFLQVYQSAQNMVDESHFAADEIKARIGHLKDHWTQLKAKCEQRRQDLEDSLQAHQYFSDATEAEAFMKEKESLAGIIWQYGLWSFHGRDTKAEIFLAKN
jgi:hypothetical protein